jgi:hypothetical protein
MGMPTGTVTSIITARQFQLARELHDQDRVLRRQADQHHQPDLREDVVVAAREPHARHRSQHAH